MRTVYIGRQESESGYRSVMARMLTAVRAALRGRSAADPRDAAAERLAQYYAGLIDEAQGIAEEARQTWSELAVDDQGGRRRLAVLEAKLQAYAVAEKLGPKLLDVLTSLGLTTAGRGAAKDGGKREPARNPLDELRARRDRRRTG